MVNKLAYFPKDCTIKMMPAASYTPSDTEALDADFSAGLVWTSRFKDINFMDGARDVSPINVMGSTQLRQEDRPAIQILSGTMVFYGGGYDVSTVKGPLSGLLGRPASSPSNFQRYQGGEGMTTDRVDMAVVVVGTKTISGVTYTFRASLNNATVTEGPISMSADNGHMEQKITIKCLASDFRYEDNIPQDPSA
jgi:hypothetical protein